MMCVTRENQEIDNMVGEISGHVKVKGDDFGRGPRNNRLTKSKKSLIEKFQEESGGIEVIRGLLRGGLWQRKKEIA